MGRTFWVALLATVSWCPVAGAQQLPPPNVPAPWRADFSTLYQGEITSAGLLSGHTLTHPWDLQSLLGTLVDTPYGLILDPFLPTTPQAIANGCRSAFPNDRWQQLHCASVQTNAYLTHHIHYSRRGMADLIRSACRDHAVLFKMVVDDLHIPGVTVGDLGLPAHVINKVTIVGSNGLPYTYVVDTGWFPDSFFPYGPNAVAYFDAHPGDNLPAISNAPLDPVAPELQHIPVLNRINPFAAVGQALNNIIPGSPLTALSKVPFLGGILSVLAPPPATTVGTLPESNGWGPAFPGATDARGYNGVRISDTRASASGVSAALPGIGQTR